MRETYIRWILEALEGATEEQLRIVLAFIRGLTGE